MRHLLERIQKIKQHFLVRLEYQRVTLDPTTRPPIITAVSTPSTVFDATFSGLRPYTNYRVRLTAVNQAMKEGYSEWSEIRTLAAPPSEMGNLSVTPTFDGRSLLFSWNEPSLPNGQVKLKNDVTLISHHVCDSKIHSRTSGEYNTFKQTQLTPRKINFPNFIAFNLRIVQHQSVGVVVKHIAGGEEGLSFSDRSIRAQRRQ